MRRFTRLAMGFSKKVENLRAACAVQIAHYNFCWRLRQKIGGKLRPTPAMAAGIVDTQWKMDDLYDAVMKQENERLQSERTDRLIAKLRQAAK